MLAAAIGVATSLRAQEPPLLDLLVERLGVYLQTYESQLSAVVADETYQQDSRARNQWGVLRARTRRLESEVAFLRLPGGREWYGIRNVRRVDRKPVAEFGWTLAELIRNPGADFGDRAKAIVIESARHNLDAGRTINMPTVPLEALSAQHHPRFIFKLRNKEKIDGVQTQRLEFEEFDEPTIVSGLSGETVWSRGNAWIEPGTGRVWRAELIAGPTGPGENRRPGLESSVRVTFALAPALDMLVPSEMVERYWIAGGRGTGHARYSNYRKFGTTARIIPQ
jgi:hypothetical protein